MKIVETYNHLNGLEVLEKKGIWDEIELVIDSVNAAQCRTKVSQERRKLGRTLYSPVDMNKQFDKFFEELGWKEDRVSYLVTGDQEVLHDPRYFMATEQQQRAIIEAFERPIESFHSYNQTDFVKEKVAVEVQFGKYAFVAYDLFVKHLAFFQQGKIDVGVEILPMKSLVQEMSSGPSYYEGELYNLMRQPGRNVLGLPLVIVGIAP